MELKKTDFTIFTTPPKFIDTSVKIDIVGKTYGIVILENFIFKQKNYPDSNIFMENLYLTSNGNYYKVSPVTSDGEIYISSFMPSKLGINSKPPSGLRSNFRFIGNFDIKYKKYESTTYGNQVSGSGLEETKTIQLLEITSGNEIVVVYVDMQNETNVLTSSPTFAPVNTNPNSTTPTVVALSIIGGLVGLLSVGVLILFLRKKNKETTSPKRSQ